MLVGRAEVDRLGQPSLKSLELVISLAVVLALACAILPAVVSHCEALIASCSHRAMLSRGTAATNIVKSYAPSYAISNQRSTHPACHFERAERVEKSRPSYPLRQHVDGHLRGSLTHLLLGLRVERREQRRAVIRTRL